MNKVWVVFFSLLVFLSCQGTSETRDVGRFVDKGEMPLLPEVGARDVSWRDPALAERVASLRTVNFSVLEYGRDGTWDWMSALDESYFALIAQAGFNGIRVPAKWSYYALEEAPYTIDPSFFEKIDHVLALCEKYGLLAILNMHHYDEISTHPRAHGERFETMWEQIAFRYRTVPDDRLWFEMLNEPWALLISPVWNGMAMDAFDVIRQTNPTRPVLFCGTQKSLPRSLRYVKLPDDPRIVVTFHYYQPLSFTHQGASWFPGSQRWVGTLWEGDVKDIKDMTIHFELATKKMVQWGVPLYMGEFGAVPWADRVSRLKWTHTVARLAESYGIGWGYWEFYSGFGIYDRKEEAWRYDLAEALYPEGNFEEWLSSDNP